MVKTKPAFALHDKEQLFDEAMKLKQNMNKYKEENIRLKTRVTLCENEVERKDKMIQELLNQINNQAGTNQAFVRRTTAETHLVSALKKQLREMKDDIRNKDEDAKKMRKNLKITRLQETEIEIRMFSDECTRLKHIIEEIMKQKASGYSPQDVAALEERINQQAALIKNIKQENGEMANAVQKKDEEINNWKDVATKLGKKLSKLESESKENVKNRKMMTDSKKEMQKLRDQLSALKSNNKDKETIAFRSRIDELLRKQAELHDKMEQKDKKIKGLEGKVAESPVKENEREREIAALKKKAKDCIKGF